MIEFLCGLIAGIFMGFWLGYAMRIREELKELRSERC